MSFLGRPAPRVPAPRATAADHAERIEMAALAELVRRDAVLAIVEVALHIQAATPAELRNRALIDLCLDLLPALHPAPPVPVIPGRS